MFLGDVTKIDKGKGKKISSSLKKEKIFSQSYDFFLFLLLFQPLTSKLMTENVLLKMMRVIAIHNGAIYPIYYLKIFFHIFQLDKGTKKKLFH